MGDYPADAALAWQMVKVEWTKIRFAHLQRLLNHPRKKRAWSWARVEYASSKKDKLCLLDARGRLWEFKISGGPHIRPLWLQYESKTSKNSVPTAA